MDVADPPTDGPGSPEALACFEAGIKFGSLYHQFVGTPISLASAAPLASAIETSIENQPYCTDVRIEVRRESLSEAIEASAASYVEFTGRFFEATVTVERAGITVVATMDLEDGYPLMRVASIDG